MKRLVMLCTILVMVQPLSGRCSTEASDPSVHTRNIIDAVVHGVVVPQWDPPTDIGLYPGMNWLMGVNNHFNPVAVRFYDHTHTVIPGHGVNVLAPPNAGYACVIPDNACIFCVWNGITGGHCRRLYKPHEHNQDIVNDNGQPKLDPGHLYYNPGLVNILKGENKAGYAVILKFVRPGGDETHTIPEDASYSLIIPDDTTHYCLAKQGTALMEDWVCWPIEQEPVTTEPTTWGSIKALFAE